MRIPQGLALLELTVASASSVSPSRTPGPARLSRDVVSLRLLALACLEGQGPTLPWGCSRWQPFGRLSALSTTCHPGQAPPPRAHGRPCFPFRPDTLLLGPGRRRGHLGPGVSVALRASLVGLSSVYSSVLCVTICSRTVPCRLAPEGGDRVHPGIRVSAVLGHTRASRALSHPRPQTPAPGSRHSVSSAPASSPQTLPRVALPPAAAVGREATLSD